MEPKAIANLKARIKAFEADSQCTEANRLRSQLRAITLYDRWRSIPDGDWPARGYMSQAARKEAGLL